MGSNKQFRTGLNKNKVDLVLQAETNVLDLVLIAFLTPVKAEELPTG